MLKILIVAPTEELCNAIMQEFNSIGREIDATNRYWLCGTMVTNSSHLTRSFFDKNNFNLAIVDYDEGLDSIGSYTELINLIRERAFCINAAYMRIVFPFISSYHHLFPKDKGIQDPIKVSDLIPPAPGRMFTEQDVINSMNETEPQLMPTGHLTTEEERINHPKHYNQHPRGIECIDVIEYMNFNIGSALKYLWRGGFKPESAIEQDYEKAIWYIRRELERLKKTKAYKEHPLIAGTYDDLTPEKVVKIVGEMYDGLNKDWTITHREEGSYTGVNKTTGAVAFGTPLHSDPLISEDGFEKIGPYLEMKPDKGFKQPERRVYTPPPIESADPVPTEELPISHPVRVERERLDREKDGH